MKLSNVISENLKYRFLYFVEYYEKYMNLYGKILPNKKSKSPKVFCFPLKNYSSFIKELTNKNILPKKMNLTIFTVDSYKGKIYEFYPYREELIDVFSKYDISRLVIPMITENILSSKTGTSDLLNFIHIENNKEIANNKANFFEYIEEIENHDFYDETAA
ncbi:MAG: hypothetical protein J1F35_03705 [Erysipelotrichales bacterium]|nr:hypothetical protein [Erysipelotrichales bacterium]